MIFSLGILSPKDLPPQLLKRADSKWQERQSEKFYQGIEFDTKKYCQNTNITDITVDNNDYQYFFDKSKQ